MRGRKLNQRNQQTEQMRKCDRCVQIYLGTGHIEEECSDQRYSKRNRIDGMKMRTGSKK